MVHRIFVEKKAGVSPEAEELTSELRNFLGVTELREVRILNRYDVEGIGDELFKSAVDTVFSEPQVDKVYESEELFGKDDDELLGKESEGLPAAGLLSDADFVFAVEPLPGQFDQRADSAAQCIQLMSRGERPEIRSAKVYALYGKIQSDHIDKIKKHLINPVEMREASLEMPETLRLEAEIPKAVETIDGFTSLSEGGLRELLEKLGLAMDIDDLMFLQQYFRDEEKRDPTITEIRVVDTYWSDHCRHTTFSTVLDEIEIENPEVEAAYERYLMLREEVYGPEKAAARPKTLMDIATLGTKVLKKRGLLPELDESEEINACSINVSAEVDGKTEPWLLMFKNETHNHPTEIEPFGGAATCIGGCIRDPLSGRAYVHQAMRVTGGGDPRKNLEDTLPGKLPQRKLARTAAAGYSSYGNQIGLATGQVSEYYHEGYIAKRLECGAVVAAAPKENVRRERPSAGDIVVLLGGRTGRDGIGGATGSSKSHDMKSLATMASEVQKGNAPEERKLQRLFRNAEASRLIKRCNDFGAGGVSVAVGELAAGLDINLDAVRKKYEGLDGTELAISESQERMAVVVAPEDEAHFIELAEAENLEAYRVAVVTESPRMRMHWRGQVVADISREFLDTNGAEKHAKVRVKDFLPTQDDPSALRSGTGVKPHDLCTMASSLKSASRRGLAERFDSTVGAGSLLMPFGGKYQRTPEQVMAALLPVLPGKHTEDGSVFAHFIDPDMMCEDPYTGAYNAVYNSVAKLVAAGADYKKAYLSLQEFFEKLRDEPERWGKPFSALLGALDAQIELSAAAIGGKDSMSGSFLDLDVPPTVISFAIAPIKAGELVLGEFRGGGHPVYLFFAEKNTDAFESFTTLAKSGKVLSARAVENGLAEAVMNMSFGNAAGFEAVSAAEFGGTWYEPYTAAIIAEMAEEGDYPHAQKIGRTTEMWAGDGNVEDADVTIKIGDDEASVGELLRLNEEVLEEVYPNRAGCNPGAVSRASSPCRGGSEDVLSAVSVKPPLQYEVFPQSGQGEAQRKGGSMSRPRAVVPVFPGTNCEYDSQRAMLDAGIDAEIFVIKNLTADDVARSAEEFAKKIRESNIIFIPGGFSGGDEPDGSAKLITAFFRNPEIKEATNELLQKRDGLMLGICNGFQALIKLGLVPYGYIVEDSETLAKSPTLTYNTIGRHQSRIANIRVASNASPWLKNTEVGEIYRVPISHGEGRIYMSEELAQKMLAEGRYIATQYCDLEGKLSMETGVNPNGSVLCIEGLMSPDGRVLGKMGHSERIGKYLYKNVPGCYDMKLFEAAAEYFR